ncbi:SDR family NAD(P)-dependent oxidoreductase [Longispora albida]|uniref:SDR family NAD(P)-dependent oxidoreductase n=1 Tax=Longispora albida TaxID=203523 RepID=UPI0003709E32|nr:glucose 1-dehydrogenase [Longispora albida]
MSKVYIVTGGTSGMGRAVAGRLAADGAAVVIAARGKERGEAVAGEIRAAGGRALFTAADLTREEDNAMVVRAALDEYGRLDGAFNNAGGVCAFGPVQEISDGNWRADLELNLSSVFYAMKHQVPALLASGGGSIVNNASNLGAVGMPGVAPYVAAKHGVAGLTRSVALENAASGIRVNALLTGGVDTPLFRATMGATEEGAAQIAALHPVGRIAEPAEIAAFTAFLLSDEAKFITGACLAIDGGFTAR